MGIAGLVKKYLTSSVTAYRHGIPGAIPFDAPPDTVTLTIGDGVNVAAGCRFRGNITINDSARVGHKCELNGNIEIGRGSNLVAENIVTDGVEIGRFCAVGPGTTFQGNNHEMHKPAMQNRLYNQVLGTSLGQSEGGSIDVGNDVWVGRDAIILPGVTVGDGAIIGAHSVVTDDVEPYSITVGTPASRKDWRFDEATREALLDIEWWKWDESEMKDNKEFFTTDLRTVENVYDLLD